LGRIFHTQEMKKRKENEMKARTIVVILTVISFLTINTAFASDCDMRYSKMISKLEESSEYMNADKQKIIPLLKEALKLCKDGKIEEGQAIIDDMNSDVLSKNIMMKIQEGN
jgi:hypothetical protein